MAVAVGVARPLGPRSQSLRRQRLVAARPPGWVTGLRPGKVRCTSPRRRPGAVGTRGCLRSGPGSSTTPDPANNTGRWCLRFAPGRRDRAAPRPRSRLPGRPFPADSEARRRTGLGSTPTPGPASSSAPSCRAPPPARQDTPAPALRPAAVPSPRAPPSAAARRQHGQGQPRQRRRGPERSTAPAGRFTTRARAPAAPREGGSPAGVVHRA